MLKNIFLLLSFFSVCFASVAQNVEKSVSYEAGIFQAKPSEIVINEIMADVSPAPFALPEKKYVELFNKSRNAFNIKN